MTTSERDFTELREAVARWTRDVCDFFEGRGPKGYRHMLTRLDQAGFETIPVPTDDLDVAAVQNVARHLDLPSLDDVGRAAVAHVDLFPKVTSAAEGSKEQRSWVCAMVAEPVLGAYLKVTRDVVFEPPTFDAVFDSLERELNSLTTPYTACAPIAEVDLPDGTLELLPDVRLRPRTETDLEDWINAEEQVASLHLNYIEATSVFEHPYLEKVGELEGARGAQDLLARLLTAIQLHANCDAHEIYLHFRRDATFHAGMGGTVMPPPHFGRRRAALRPRDITPVVTLYRALESGPNRAQCALALERWSSLVSGARAQNVIVDSWVGLESLLFRETSTSEITYRASLRLAALIGRDSAERHALLHAARRSYHARSTILHGADATKLDLQSLAGESRDYLRRALVTILQMEDAFDPNAVESQLLA